jgi:3-keto-5-aminohexanoate cleavage enzyme
MKPVVIAVAITGSVPRKKDNPAVPVTVAEQIESTHEAYEAGASLVHLHVRNPDESSSSDPALFASVLEGIRKHCPGMIVQFSTGGRGATRPPAAPRCTTSRTWHRWRPAP